MRIAFISYQFDSIRGGSSLFGDLFSVLGRLHDIRIFTREDRYSIRHWHTTIIPSRGSSRFAWLAEFLFARRAVQGVLAEHAKRPFDLILINQTVSRGLFRLRAAGVPIVYVIHHPLSIDRKLALTESTSFIERVQWLLRYGRMERAQAALAGAFPVLTVSNTAAGRIRSDYQVEQSNVRVILNGIDVDFFHKTAATEKHTVLAVGSYQHPRRGFPYLLETYRALARKGYRIIDVGRRTDEQEKMIRTISSVEVLGPVATREEIRTLYSRASVFISTSLYEGFGLSVAEALACGTPVSVFDAGGLHELLDIVDPGMLNAPRDVGALVATAERYADSDDDAAAQKRIQIIKERFSLSRMADDYERLFQSLVNEQIR